MKNTLTGAASPLAMKPPTATVISRIGLRALMRTSSGGGDELGSTTTDI